MACGSSSRASKCNTAHMEFTLCDNSQSSGTCAGSQREGLRSATAQGKTPQPEGMAAWGDTLLGGTLLLGMGTTAVSGLQRVGQFGIGRATTALVSAIYYGVHLAAAQYACSSNSDCNYASCTANAACNPNYPGCQLQYGCGVPTWGGPAICTYCAYSFCCYTTGCTYQQYTMCPSPGSAPSSGSSSSSNSGPCSGGALQVGNVVQVNKSVVNPENGWGSVSYSSVGTITSILENTVIVDFPEQSSWNALPSELQLVCASCVAGTYGDANSAICTRCSEGKPLWQRSARPRSIKVSFSCKPFPHIASYSHERISASFLN